ncbi:putative membrane protein, partial [Chlamydia psittaci 84-8471/1]
YRAYLVLMNRYQ